MSNTKEVLGGRNPCFPPHFFLIPISFVFAQNAYFSILFSICFLQQLLFLIFVNTKKTVIPVVNLNTNKEGWHKTNCSGGGRQSLFEFKNAFKIGRTFGNMCLKVWLNAHVLTYFSFFWSYNFFTNFNLKLKNFVFFEILNILKITVFCSKSISSICMSFCSN